MLFWWHDRFTDHKLHSIDSAQDASVVLRTIASQKQKKILLREYRPHLLASCVTYKPSSIDQVTDCDRFLCPMFFFLASTAEKV